MSLSRTRAAAWCAFFSLVGLGVSGYLAYLHIGLLRGELLGGAVCTSSGAFNCHAVTGGAWGQLFGMPLALWGAIGYLVTFSLALLAQQSEETAASLMPLLAACSTLFLLVDVWLFYVMFAIIRLYCFLCLSTDVVNLALFFTATRAAGGLRALGQAGAAVGRLIPGRANPGAALFWGLILVSLIGVVGVHASTTYVSQGSTVAIQRQLRDFVHRQPRVILDATGDPRHGSPSSPITVVEFSDFHCPACQRAAKFNTIMLANHRRDVMFVFKNYPLDTTCNDKISRLVHPGACQVAAASECVNEQGQFWPFHDMVFAQGAQYPMTNLEGDLTRLRVDLTKYRECMQAGRGLEAVKRDIAEAAKVPVISTPTYVINGLPMAGGISPTMFDELVSILRESQ